MPSSPTPTRQSQYSIFCRQQESAPILIFCFNVKIFHWNHRWPSDDRPYSEVSKGQIQSPWLGDKVDDVFLWIRPLCIEDKFLDSTMVLEVVRIKGDIMPLSIID